MGKELQRNLPGTIWAREDNNCGTMNQESEQEKTFKKASREETGSTVRLPEAALKGN